MAGKQKVQFSNDADGHEFWRLYEQIAQLRLQQQKEKVLRLREQHPDLRIEMPLRPVAAGPLVLALMREELARLIEGKGTWNKEREEPAMNREDV